VASPYRAAYKQIRYTLSRIPGVIPADVLRMRGRHLRHTRQRAQFGPLPERIGLMRLEVRRSGIYSALHGGGHGIAPRPFRARHDDIWRLRSAHS
jgi:hypothetical protein